MDFIGRLVARPSNLVVPAAKHGVKMLRARVTSNAHTRLASHGDADAQRRLHSILSPISASSYTRTKPFGRGKQLANFKLRLSPANSISGARLSPAPPRPHSLALRFISKPFSSTSRTACSSIIPSSIMADRDILPANVKPSHYDLAISSLEFKDWTYQGKVT